MNQIILTSILCFSSLIANAAIEGRANFDNVTGLKIGSGYVEIKLENEHGNPGGCSGYAKSIFIDENNPNKDQMLSLALYAKASNAQLTAWISGCTDFSGNKVSNLEVK